MTTIPSHEPMSWRTASARFTAFRDYIAQNDAIRTAASRVTRRQSANTDPSPTTPAPRQSWEQWARQKLHRKPTGDLAPSGVEQVLLFPGWAVRRYRHNQDTPEDGDECVVEVSVAGFAAAYRPPERATRSQRAFMRLARGFAALPKLSPTAKRDSLDVASPSLTESPLPLPTLQPKPDDATNSIEDSVLDDLTEITESPTASRSSSPELQLDADDDSTSEPTPVDEALAEPLEALAPEETARLHENFASRLRHFWASPLVNRTVRVSIFFITTESDAQKDEPVLTQDVLTSTHGAFCLQLKVPWERMCTHPHASRVAFARPHAPHEVLVHARLLPAPATLEQPAQVQSQVTVALSNARVRVISDIDDTVKDSQILKGPRAVFRNVFVKHLPEVVIPAMAEWYTDLHKRGVRFHYVSNSPSGLLPLLTDFLTIAKLPQGSLKLKFYSGRSLFQGLWEQAGERKRPGVVEVLEAFPDTKFFLVGDSGEQDLELYAALAREYPTRVLAVYIRDVSTVPLAPLDRPAPEFTERRLPLAVRSATDLPLSWHRKSMPHKARTDPSASQPPSPGTRTPVEKLPGAIGASEGQTPAERRRTELQARLDRARMTVPRHIPVRVFREPSECVEVAEIVKKLESRGML